MDPEATVRDYYDALREGEPLGPYFADEETTVKFGISETLRGPETVVDGLREQTATTTGWQVDSHNLVVGQDGDGAWFTDEVFMGWTDTDRRVRYEFETRWSGTLLRRGDGWRFVTMHVSTAGDR